MQQGAAPLESLAQVYGSGAYAPFLRSLRLAGSQAVPLVRFSQPGGAFPDPPTGDYTLAINEAGGGTMEFDIGLGRSVVPFRHGDLVLKPPAVATFFANDRPHAKSFISLPAELVAGHAREAGGAAAPDLGRLHEGVFRSPVIARLIELIWSESEVDSPYGRMFTDGSVLSLVATLLRLATPEPARAAAPAGLGATRLARVQAWVLAHLAEPFGLAEMARSVGLSPFHFSRAFKATTGQTPSAYVAACRIERAKELLAATSLPLAEIAYGCGFADQAHFTTCFRRHAGLAPGAWRRARR